VGGGYYLVTPADLATIYNFNPLFSAGMSGQNQTIYLIEDTDLYSTNDWTTFRSAFGLSAYTGASLSTVHPAPPSGSNNCNAPGVNADDGEAILDAEYASAAAPSAAIVMASCRSSFTTFGGLIAMQNLINGPNPPAIISLSYGECEAFNGATSNAAYNAIFQQGVAEGTSIFVASGDADAGVCDNGTAVTHGIGVSAFASTPYNVAVGGTDFSDTYSGTNTTYWNSANDPANGSALSYIPEIPWNDSCASQLLATFLNYVTTYGASGFCNTSAGANFLNNVGGSGGPSGCATGSPSTSGVVSGTCAGYPKPSWQAGVVGIPNDGVRGLPDVSLFAANGLWGHYYVFCYSDPTSGYGGAPCTGAPSGWSAAGGTSFATPIMAGVQALVNQKAGGRQGNPNYRYYALAANQYGASGDSTCNSSNGNAVAMSCIFYDVTLGDIDAVCTGSNNCYTPSGTNGVLSTSNSSYAPAYGAATGGTSPPGSAPSTSIIWS
jgi:subtilase family serine protease